MGVQTATVMKVIVWPQEVSEVTVVKMKKKTLTPHFLTLHIEQLIGAAFADATIGLIKQIPDVANTGMAKQVVEFSNWGYKIRKIFAQESIYIQKVNY